MDRRISGEKCPKLSSVCQDLRDARGRYPSEICKFLFELKDGLWTLGKMNEEEKYLGPYFDNLWSILGCNFFFEWGD